MKEKLCYLRDHGHDMPVRTKNLLTRKSYFSSFLLLVLFLAVTPRAMGQFLQVIDFSGNTICSGGTGKLRATILGGKAPYNVVYNDGVADRTATAVMPGVPFNVFVDPVVNTSYKLVSITDANGTSTTAGFIDGSADVHVNAGPVVHAGAILTSICSGSASFLSSTASAALGNFSYTNWIPGIIPDHSLTGISRKIAVEGLPSSLSEIINIAVTINIAHDEDKDLDVFLVRPGGSLIAKKNKLHIVDGESICLVANKGNKGNNFIATVFSDDAAKPVSSGKAPFTGMFRPKNAFSTLTGNPNGTWILKVIDDHRGTVGILKNWSIRFTFRNGVTFNWTSDPPGFTSSLQNPGNVYPTVSTNYQLVVTDIATGCSTTVQVPIAVSQPPTTANAGSPQNIAAGTSATLAANSAVTGTGTWSVLSGPDLSVSQFSNANDPAAVFTPAGTGEYSLAWTIANPPCPSSSAIGTITVSNNGNIAPIAAAGKDTTIIAPAGSAMLNAGQSTDANGTITGYEWTNLSGPSVPGIADPAGISTSVDNLVEGVYSFMLRVTDNDGATDTDTVRVLVGARVLIDIGDDMPTPVPDADGKYWNNMISAMPGVQIDNAVTVNNTATTIDMEVVNRIDGTFNPPENGLFHNDAPVAAVGDYPSTATSDYAFADVSTTVGQWKLSGLDMSKQYTVKFWGSKTADNRITQIKRSDETTWQEYDAAFNTDYDRAAVFTFSGVTEMSFDIRVKEGSVFGYINIIDITAVPVIQQRPVLHDEKLITAKPVLQLTRSAGMQVYPNPSRGNFNITLASVETGEPVTIQVMNSMGQVIWQETRKNSPVMQMNHTLPNGLYWINCITGDKKTTKKVLVKQ